MVLHPILRRRDQYPVLHHLAGAGIEGEPAPGGDQLLHPRWWQGQQQVALVKHGEHLKEGRIYNDGLEVHYRLTDDTDPFQIDIYTLNGNGEEVFAPKFNYKGFQYAEVAGNGALCRATGAGFSSGLSGLACRDQCR